MLTQIKGEAR